MQTQSYTDTNSYTNYTLNIAISITFPINNCNDWMRNKIFKTYESITAAKSGWDSGQMRRIIGSVALSLSPLLVFDLTTRIHVRANDTIA